MVDDTVCAAHRPRHFGYCVYITGLVAGDVPVNPAKLVLDIFFQRITRGDIDRGEDRDNQKCDQSEYQKRPLAEYVGEID